MSVEVYHEPYICNLGTLDHFDISWLRKAIEWVTEQVALPETERVWNQAVWREQGALSGRNCKTVMCVAGYLAECSPDYTWRFPELSDDIEMIGPRNEFSTPREVAAQMIGLCSCEASALFHANNTAAMVVDVARSVAASRGEDLGV
jgi:hypothetical protein